ncbi:3-methyladenine DNA glycosylase/8-oxoguanine DNA glycosylase [Catenulispora sp. GAS73]|uniref:DNA-3-methyladenine glycosylase family protein n=1 Tax=Catenulispora sp. GAS73 TaxID=3156269 RepID=UPI003513CDAF
MTDNADNTDSDIRAVWAARKGRSGGAAFERRRTAPPRRPVVPAARQAPPEPAAEPEARQTLVVDPGYDLAGSVSVLRRGAGDPTFRRAEDASLWIGCRTPSGDPGALRLRRATTETVEAEAWGPGAAWLLKTLPDFLGLSDSEETRAEFAELVAAQGNPQLVQSLRRNKGLRVIRSGRVWDSLVPAVLEQRVTVQEAHRAYQLLVRRYGIPAPGAPAEVRLWVSPSPREWALIPSWEWHRAGVDGKRSRAILGASRVAARLEETVGMERDEAARRIRTVPGIGVWTAAEVMHRSHGDADAVSVGDLHLPRIVCGALGDPAMAWDDDRMLELLEPYRGHRYRVSALLYR